LKDPLFCKENTKNKVECKEAEHGITGSLVNGDLLSSATTYPVMGPNVTTRTPYIAPMIGGTATPGNGFLMCVAAKIQNTNTPVPNASIKKACTPLEMYFELRLQREQQNNWYEIVAV